MYVRTRLALGFMAVVAVMLAVFGSSVFHETRGSLLAEVQRDVQQRADLLAVTAQRSHMRLRPPAHLDVYGAPDVYLQLVLTDGSTAASSGNLGSRQLPFFPEDAKTGVVREVRMGGVPLMEATRVVKDQTGAIRGYAIAARSPGTIYQAVDRLRTVLVPRAFIALAVAGVAGWLIAWLSLRPLRRLAATAAEIAVTTDHAQRVKVGKPRDEIRKLAVTINKMLDALQNAYRSLKASNAAQRQFLADVSHQLRTPLTVIRSSVEILDRSGGGDPDFAAQVLTDVREESDRMSRMIHQLLLMARAETRLPTDTRPLLMAELMTDLSRHYERLDSRIRWSSPNQLEGAVVRGDADYLIQLFSVLIDNALKYTPADGSIDVSGNIDDGEAVIRVVDTGVGIATEDIPHIFDRFYRAKNAPPHNGSGLGLAIAKRITELHDGRISIESELNRGTQVLVHLPLMTHP
jgi:two-component system, OmpR family, sensor kinase